MYGFLIAIGIFLSLSISEKLVKQDKKDATNLWEVAFWMILGGIIGARFYHVLDFFNYYKVNPIQIFAIWQGGLGIYGAIFGSILAGYIYLSKKGLQKGYWLSFMATTAPLAQALGRVGNFFNQELYGKITTLPWGITINNQRHHPLFFYEALANVILFIFLIKVRKRYPNTTLFLYIAGYAGIRFFLEFLRINPWTFLGLNVAQIISILGLTISLFMFFKMEKI